MERLDLALILGAAVLTLILLVTIAPLPARMPATHEYNAFVKETIEERSNAKDYVIELSPTVVRKVEVLREGKVVESYTKVGDPISLQWYRLIANWMFGLYYWQREPVYTISGYNRPGLDTANGGSPPTLYFYVTNSTEPVGFDTYSISNLTSGAVDVSDVSNSTHYIAWINGRFVNTFSGVYNVTKVTTLLDYDYDLRSYIYKDRIIFLLDELNPPVTLNPDDVISVSWFIIFPKSEPYTDEFWSLLKTFMGLNNYPDYGADNYASDLIREYLAFSLVYTNATESGKFKFDIVTTFYNDTGYYVKLIGHYTADQNTTIDVAEVKIHLYTDSDVSSTSADAYLPILPYTLGSPVHLGPFDTLIVKLTIKFDNYFTTG